MARRQQRRPEGWVSTLADGGLEVFVRVPGRDGAPDRKLRASGPESEMQELLDWLEAKTGLRINMVTRVRARRGPRPMPGQEALNLELSSDATVGT